MWAILSHPGHVEDFSLPRGEYSSLHRLVERLVRRPYADEIYAYTSMATFALTTAPNYSEARGHDSVRIEFDPATGLFRVDYDEWASPTRNPQRRTMSSRPCEWPGVIDTVDCFALRMLLISREGSRFRPVGPSE